MEKIRIVKIVVIYRGNISDRKRQLAEISGKGQDFAVKAAQHAAESLGGSALAQLVGLDDDLFADGRLKLGNTAHGALQPCGTYLQVVDLVNKILLVNLGIYQPVNRLAVVDGNSAGTVDEYPQIPLRALLGEPYVPQRIAVALYYRSYSSVRRRLN